MVKNMCIPFVVEELPRGELDAFLGEVDAFLGEVDDCRGDTDAFRLLGVLPLSFLDDFLTER